MSNLESRIPFDLGTYHFNLHWKWFRIGHATLSFYEKDSNDLPKNVVYSGNGSLYEVVFKASIELPLLSSIVEDGRFTAIVCVDNQDAHPLISIAETKILGYKSTLTSVYDYSNNKIIINSKEHNITPLKMPHVRDPTSHVIHVLFRPRIEGGSYFCGYYHNMNGCLENLTLHYAQENDSLVGRATIPAGAYLVNTEFMLELPYSKKGNLFVPSLKERVAVGHKRLGKVIFEFVDFCVL